MICQEVMNLSTQAHNLKVAGSNPAPATKNNTQRRVRKGSGVLRYVIPRACQQEKPRFVDRTKDKQPDRTGQLQLGSGCIDFQCTAWFTARKTER